MARNPGFTRANIGPEWRRVDLLLRKRDDKEPRHDFARLDELVGRHVPVGDAAV